MGPAHAASLARAKAVPVDQTDQHAVAEWIPAALAGGFDKAMRFGEPQIAAILNFRLFVGRAGVRRRSFVSSRRSVRHS